MISLETTQNLLITYKYVLLFPISTLEGPITVLLSGFLWSIGIFNVYAAYLILMAGDMTGDTIFYLIGRYGGRAFIKKWGHLLKIDEEKLNRTEAHYKQHAGKTLLFAKTQVFGAVFLSAAGLAKMPFPKYILLNFLGSAVKIFGLLLLGYYFGQAYTVLTKYLDYYIVISLSVVTLVAIIYFLNKRKNEKANHRN